MVTPKANGREGFLFATTEGVMVLLRDGTTVVDKWKPVPPCMPPVPCLLEGELILSRTFMAYDCVASPTFSYTNESERTVTTGRCCRDTTKHVTQPSWRSSTV